MKSLMLTIKSQIEKSEEKKGPRGPVVYLAIQNGNLEYGERRCGFKIQSTSTKKHQSTKCFAAPREDFGGRLTVRRGTQS